MIEGLFLHPLIDDRITPVRRADTTMQATPDFEVHARTVTTRVRGAFASLLSSVGADPTDPQSIGKHAGLNKNLAWKLSKIVLAEDPATVLDQMPGAAGLKILLDRTQQAGANSELLDETQQAIDAFEQLIQVHSGDRETLEMMTTELSSSNRKERDEQHRKAFFQGASYVWGAQARVNQKIILIAPGTKTNHLDLGIINAFHDFRRLRPDVHWVMSLRRLFDDRGKEVPHNIEAVDPHYSDPQAAPLLPEFCSQPLPDLVRYDDGPGHVVYELGKGRIGNTGAITCALGTITRNIPSYATPGNEWGGHLATSDTPAEFMIVDLLVHQDLSFAIPPQAELHGQLRKTANWPTDRTRLQMHEQLQDLGTGPFLLPTPEVPRHREMINALISRMNLNPTAIRGFRMKIAYPPCPAVLLLRYRLPQLPA